MKGQALRRQRAELGATAEQVAEYAGVDPGVLQEWERLDLGIPRAEAARVRMALYMLRSEQVMARSGLPDCEWVAGLEEGVDPAVLEEHARGCDVCRARTEYARKHGPRMPGAMGIVMSVMGPAERLSGPVRSAYLGFMLVLMITGIPVVGMLVLGLVTLDGEALLGAVAVMAATIGGGAAGGIAHYYTGPLRRLGAAGHYGSWVLTVYGYLAGLLAVAWVGVSVAGGASIAGDARDLLDMVGDPVGLVIFLVLGAIFGLVAGKGARAGPELELETAAEAGSAIGREPGSSPEPGSPVAPEPGSRDEDDLAPILMIGAWS